MSSKTAVSKPSDPKDADKPAQKPNVSLEEDDEFEDFPAPGELRHYVAEFMSPCHHVIEMSGKVEVING